MERLTRRWRLVKWTGTALLLFIATGWWLTSTRLWLFTNDCFGIGLCDGRLYVTGHDKPPPKPRAKPARTLISTPPTTTRGDVAPTSAASRPPNMNTDSTGLHWAPRIRVVRPTTSMPNLSGEPVQVYCEPLIDSLKAETAKDLNTLSILSAMVSLSPWWRPSITAQAVVIIPMAVPLALAAVATAILFWLDRRRIPPHCCQSCGYDLTGNTSGTCPECGRQDGRSEPND